MTGKEEKRYQKPWHRKVGVMFCLMNPKKIFLLCAFLYSVMRAGGMIQVVPCLPLFSFDPGREKELHNHTIVL
jgi:hypothetical protein